MFGLDRRRTQAPAMCRRYRTRHVPPLRNPPRVAACRRYGAFRADCVIRAAERGPTRASDASCVFETPVDALRRSFSHSGGLLVCGCF